MPSSQIEQIQDAELRELMRQAEARLDEGDNTGCVRLCADAYLTLLERQPQVLEGLRKVLATPRVKAGIDNGTLRFAPLLFPRLAAKLQLPNEGVADAKPSIRFDRETVSFSEAIQYYEFTLNLICDAEKGTLQTTAPGVSL
jgi:hypothetical protein